MLKVEFHCHTLYSLDSLTKPEDLVKKAFEKGIDRVAVTDHNTIKGALIAKAFDPERVIVGEEILTTEGELLALFIQEEVPALMPPMKTIEILRQQNAFISVSHPFDRQRSGWREEGLAELIPFIDAIEVFNSRSLNKRINQKAMNFAKTHKLPGTVGSDAHTTRELGMATLTLPAFDNSDELRRVIKTGIQHVRLAPWWVHFYSTYAKIFKKISRLNK